MPALTKEKFVKRVQAPARIHPRSSCNNDVKRLGPNRRISAKRTQAQSIQTESVLACLKYTQMDEGTQTNDEINHYAQGAVNGFAARLVRFFGGTIVSFMKIFSSVK